jgi:uncharacterized membrane protein (DUF106 family)
VFFARKIMKNKIVRRYKMEQKYVLGIVALAMVALLGIGVVSSFGFGNGFMNQDMTDEEKAEMQEQQEAMQTAISEGDYSAWKSLMEERIAKMQEQITEENFNTLKEQHQKMSEFRTAMQEAREFGDFSKVEELQEEYGFEGKGFGKGNRMHGQKMNFGEGPCFE